jgi:hypothetical protein
VPACRLGRFVSATIAHLRVMRDPLQWTTVEFYPFKRATVTFMSVGCFACAAGSFAFCAVGCELPGNAFAGFMGCCFMYFALVLLTPTRTALDTSARLLSRERMLFGRIRLWGRKLPFTRFCAVVVRQTDPESDFLVGLRRESGRTLWVRCEYGLAQANVVAHRLSAYTGLPIDEIENT